MVSLARCVIFGCLLLQVACGSLPTHSRLKQSNSTSGAHHNQGEVHVGVVGDSISQGSFGETLLGAPFPKHYASFYDRHLHLLAHLKFAPSKAIRTHVGRIMGGLFKDLWYTHSFIANQDWGLKAKFQRLHPTAQIRMHSQALMAATSDAVAEQIQGLFASNVVYDYFFFAIGTNDVCSGEQVKPEVFRANITRAFQNIRARSAAPIFVLEVSPLQKVAAATDEQGASILDRPIDYREFRRHLGLSSVVAHIGLMPRDCREHIKLECPAGIDSTDLEATIARFNSELSAAVEAFSDIRIVRFDPNIEIKASDLGVDCFHPNLKGQKKFFADIDLAL